VKILEKDKQRLDLALANQQALDRIKRLLSALGRIEAIPRGIASGDREQPQYRGEIGLQGGAIEGQDLPRDPFNDTAAVVPGLDLEVGPEKIDDRPEACGLAVGRQGGLEREISPPYGEMS